MLRHSAMLAALCSLLLPVAASGQRADPDSPAGVEYALPLEQARDSGADGDDGGPSSGRARLFGAGIVASKNVVTPGRRRAGDEAGGRARAGDEDSSASGAAGKDRGDSDSPSGDRPIAGSGVLDAGASEDSATWQIAGLALAVLLAGGLLGIVLRRGLRPTGD